MGKSNAQKQAEQQSAAAEAERAQLRSTIAAGTPEANAQKERIASRRTAITAGDMSNAPDFVGNSAAQADLTRKSEAAWNATPTGLMAIGTKYANPNTMGLQTKILKARQAQASAGNLENQWSNYVADTNQMENGVVNRQDNINGNLMNDSASRAQSQQQLAAQIAAQRSNMYAGLLGAGLGAAGSLIKPISI